MLGTFMDKLLLAESTTSFFKAFFVDGMDLRPWI